MVFGNKLVAGLVKALYIFGVCGIASIFLDLDHVLGLVLKGLPITMPNLTTQAGRPLHLPAVLASGAVFCISCALYPRWTDIG
jgi:hypothetical protein